MGCASSKPEKDVALRLCKERKKFIKQAIDSRCALAAAHVSYNQALRNIGTALRRFAEAEVLIESSLSASATELDKTPSNSSYPSASPSHIAEVSDSPVHNKSPLSPPMSTLSYMRCGGSAAAVTVMVNPPSNNFVHEESVAFSMPPPPPPPDFDSSWDFFDPAEDVESFRLVRSNGGDVNIDNMRVWKQFGGKEVGLDRKNEPDEAFMRLKSERKASVVAGYSGTRMVSHSQSVEHDASSIPPEGFRSGHFREELPIGKAALEQSSSEREMKVGEKDLSEEREDPSEFITHRAKDFLSSIKDIEHRFFRASESGKEVSRLLEANRIRVGYSEVKGSSFASAFLAAVQLVCCRGKTALVSHEPPQNVTKIITWNRSTSSQSSSSKNLLAASARDDVSESGSDYVEAFCMFAGSHSSTLDRLYAWERKLYDEVKASQPIRREYDRKCNQLRHQFAKDLSSQVIDKTRSVVKDLHSRIRVAIQAVDSISKRIEKMRDEELLPQLLELIQGLIKMWKDMLECHHAQYITISLAYHARSSRGTPPSDTQQPTMAQLQQEIECFGSCFADWINSHTSYVDALYGWMQNCILLQPQERSKSRRPFSPRRALAPPIFVLCRDWLAGIKSLPSDELIEAIKTFSSDLHSSMGRQAEELQKKQKSSDSINGESETKEEERNDDQSSNLSSIQASLTKVLDRLTKFSEASLKTYEDIRKKNEADQRAYSNCRPAVF
ncbi:protein ALTERED PHOSPHATE STARVATION RESPONSE 1 isoform X1 [Malania oleifera]|uniref:protein ALTERED PHOSPHATE STARVATION RESPONSE 1 isoform X1 n=1 Tax=Malania oleifera TaxID=397392 RepID=UPI0025AE0E6A|nr:protein ALTERED PHOSPHATE STARVATION RESPONSE 1 isoform X1 [Malania oleifera]XP_057971858.1 protein ALTERED PHOSPHATE STARVATION RESPONSE 1 isoform X1 [Malania oleifera]